MICPRCGNEWDASKGPCTRCGLVIRIPGQSGPLGRSSGINNSQQNISQQSAGSPPSRPQSSSGSFGTSLANTGQSGSSASFRGSTRAPNTPQAPSNEQAPNTPLPYNFSPAPETPRSSTPSSASMPGFGGNGVPHQTYPQAQPNPGLSSTPAEASRIDSFASRSVPQRPQTAPPPLGRFTETLNSDIQRPQSPLRASRLVTDPLAKRPQQRQRQTLPPLQQNMASPSKGSVKSLAADLRQLIPGTILRGGRYRLQEPQGSQEWLSGVLETMWIAQDAQRGASRVMICEVVLPDNGSVVMQSTLRTATMALTSVGRHPHIPTLWDAFSDRGRSFFAFEPVEGESLMSRMRRNGRALQEQDVIEWCLQMTEILELLAQQSPPLVHGLISPEHILVTRSGSQYILTNFSIVLAGGATQFISGIDRTRLSVYTAPEFVRGVIDVRSDLFSLMATAYHAITGSPPAGVSGSVPQAQRLNPNVSPQFDAILSKGLRPIANQRYQRPSELRQDLLAMRSVTGTIVPGSGQRVEPPVMAQPVSRTNQRFEPYSTAVPDSIAQTFQSLAPSEDIGEEKILLPRPEELPPLKEGNDVLGAALWLGVVVICLLLIVFFTRGFL